MSRFPISSWAIVSCFALVTAFAGCAGDTTSSQQTGSLNLNLELADGIVINEVAWTISGGDMDPMSGTIDTSAPGATASVEVFGLPPGQGYLVELAATDETGEITCGGDAQFDVEVGVSTDVMVFLNCKRPTTLGGVRVNGKFNICAELAKVVVSPLQTSVGNDIDLSAQTVDVEGDPVTIMWSGTGGSIADASADQTTYTCGTVGPQSITVIVSDDDFEYCMDDWTVAVTCVEGAGDLCEGVVCEDDGNECTAEACNPATGACESSNVADGTECDGGAGTCMEGTCVANDLCEGVVCEDDGNECTAEACNPATGACESSNVADGTECDGGAGTCMEGTCVANDLCEGVVCEDDGNECTAEACNPNTGSCESSNVADGTECDGGNGTCNAGVCEPTVVACDYEQDFESLDQASTSALGDAGFLVFGNVYSPTTGDVIGFYGPFPAPNNPASPAFSLIASGEGGPDQGAQQVVIISDYNNQTEMVAGNLVEALTFQEVTIQASDVGKTLTFSFDAKRGDIGGNSTAYAFIKTLAPPAFDQTNLVTVDTTNLPTTWGRLEISLDIVPELVGQILQFGFSATATNNEPSGVFYDNLTFGTPGCSGTGGGGGGELAINGDFETGDATGWLTDFVAPNNGTFTVTSAQSNGGTYSGNLVASVPAEGGPPSFPLIKQANIGIGTVQPNSTVEISFDLFGSVSGAGGVFFAEFFSELSGGGTSKSEILSGGPLFPNGTWTTYSFTTTTGPDVSGGVTLQLKADCGANPGCTVDAYIDNVSVFVP